ncbi:MAG: hypothetical protein KIT83_12275 [Bryobacterales bacterium]|nr:hypothetical protein [Bryobacterales bacterium]
MFKTVTLVVDMVKEMVARSLAESSSPFCESRQRAVGHRLSSLIRGAILACLLVASFAVVCSAAAQDPAAESIGEPLLTSIRAEVRKSLEATANHTCLLRIHRVQEKASLGQKMEEHASVEVAYLGGRERFAWPGERAFRDDDLRDVLVMGLSGSGSFAEHIRSVVLGDDTVFGSPLEITENGAPLVRIPYQVPAGRSGYLVNLDGREIEAAIRGQITVRSADSVILAFTLEAFDLPADFPATSVTEAIRYQPELLGSFRPPAQAAQRMVEAGTDVYSNEYRFENCREFRGDSSVRFGSSQPGDASSSSPQMAGGVLPTVEPLPPGAPVELRLRSAISWGKLRTGDPVDAELGRPLKFAGQLLANSGAKVLGRVVEFKQLSSAAGTGYYIGIQFESIEENGKLIPVSLVLDALTDMPKSNRRGLAAMVRGDTAPYELMDRIRPDGSPYPGTGFIRVLGDPNGLPAGLSMRWVAADPERPAPRQ